MVDFCFENRKIILNPIFLFLDFLFEIVYIFFFILQQENQVIREDLPPVRVQEFELGSRAIYRYSRSRILWPSPHIHILGIMWRKGHVFGVTFIVIDLRERIVILGA